MISVPEKNKGVEAPLNLYSAVNSERAFPFIVVGVTFPERITFVYFFNLIFDKSVIYSFAVRRELFTFHFFHLVDSSLSEC